MNSSEKFYNLTRKKSSNQVTNMANLHWNQNKKYGTFDTNTLKTTLQMTSYIDSMLSVLWP